MRVRFFCISAREPAAEAEELNELLASCRVLAVDRHLVADGPASFWAISVSYLERAGGAPLGRKGKIDYRFRLARAQTPAPMETGTPAPDPTFALSASRPVIGGRRRTSSGAGVRVGRWTPPRKLTGALFSC